MLNESQENILNSLNAMIKRFEAGEITSIQFCYIDTSLRGNIEMYVMVGDEEFALRQLNSMINMSNKTYLNDENKVMH